MSEEDKIQTDRVACADWLRELADRVEEGRAEGVFTVAVEGDGSTRARVSVLVPQAREMAALALLLFWSQNFSDAMRIKQVAPLLMRKEKP